jgi:hypothetical protein
VTYSRMNTLKIIGRIVSIHCSEVSRIASDELEQPVGVADRLALWGHLIGCRSCRRFRSQIGEIREQIRLVPSDYEVESRLPDAARARLRLAIISVADQARPNSCDSGQ